MTAKKKAKTKHAKAKTSTRKPSKTARAREFMMAETKKIGGHRNVDRAWKSKLLDRAVSRFGIMRSTAATQYSVHVSSR